MSADDAAHNGSHLLQPISTTASTSAGAKQSSLGSSLTPPVRSLTYAELVEVCEALGGTPGLTAPVKSTSSSLTATKTPSSLDEKHLSVTTQPDDEEKQNKLVPTIRTDTPRGLYRRVKHKKKHCQIMYWVLSSLYNACLLLQLLLGASLTSLGASDKKKSTAITIIAAANTVNAGLIALLHNSGIPTRYRNDLDEWSKVEVYMMDIMDSGVVQANMSKDDVVATCQAMYNAAFATIENNKPSSYVPTIAVAVTNGTDGKTKKP